MDQEQSWLTIKTIGEDDNTAATNYEYFMRPEPRDNMGPIKTVYDKLLQRKIKVRDLSIGMTRNAKEENKKTVRAYLEPYPHTRINTCKPLQGWYKSLHEPNGVRPRPCFTEAILTEPYGGWCMVGCSFCYVNSGFRGYRGTGLITVPVNYGEQVQKQLDRVRRGAAVYFSSFTDPFLTLEDLYHNTEESAKVCVQAGLPIFFLSRLRYPDWAIQLMRQNPHSYAQKSINTPDPNDWKKFSPGALSLEGHLKDITRLKRAGIYVSIQCNPIIPGVTSNQQVCQLFKMLADAGADHVIVKFVEAGFSWAPTMVERTVKRFGERGKAFAALFTENIGGQRTIEEAYRIKSHKLFASAAKRVGLTYATCYEYRYERNPEGYITDKTGVSIGREFTTSAQCHGHAVPMYTRESSEEQFKPVLECPPSGCLYCAEENGGKARCGDALAGEATALRLVDLKLPIRSKS
jgi:DNA repair photolyase